MWIGWHHPMWKPSFLQWRHLQTIGSNSSVGAGDPNRQLAALHSTLCSTFSPHLYLALLNFLFPASLFSSMHCSFWLLLLHTFPPLHPSTSANNRARHFAKNKDESVDFFKVFTLESCTRLWLGGVSWKTVIHSLNLMWYNHRYLFLWILPSFLTHTCRIFFSFSFRLHWLCQANKLLVLILLFCFVFFLSALNRNHFQQFEWQKSEMTNKIDLWTYQSDWPINRISCVLIYNGEK